MFLLWYLKKIHKIMKYIVWWHEKSIHCHTIAVAYTVMMLLFVSTELFTGCLAVVELPHSDQLPIWVHQCATHHILGRGLHSSLLPSFAPSHCHPPNWGQLLTCVEFVHQWSDFLYLGYLRFMEVICYAKCVPCLMMKFTCS